MQKLKKAEAKLDHRQCVLNQKRVKFLEHVLTPHGLQIDEEKV